MNILAVDAASKCGWALSMSGALESGVEDFSLRRGESPGARFLRFRKWLLDMSELCRRQTGRDLELIVYEQAHHRGGAATEVCVGLTTRLQEHQAGIAGCECVAVHTATLKKRATGRGNAKKPEMIAAARERWGIVPSDDNHADALCLLALGLDQYATAPAVQGEAAR